jgi:hypothetical protein
MHFIKFQEVVGRERDAEVKIGMLLNRIKKRRMMQNARNLDEKF